MDTTILGLGIGAISIVAAAIIKQIKNNDSSTDISVDEWSPLYEREKIIKYLPYEDFIEDDGIYITKDGGVGLVIECMPFPLVGTKAHTSIKSMLDVLPENTNVQFSLFSGADIVDQLEAWKETKTRKGDIENSVVQAYEEFLNSKKYEGISKNFSAPIRNVRLIVSIKLGGKEKKHQTFGVNFLKGLFGDDDPELNRFQENYRKIHTIKDRAIGILNAGNFGASICDPNRLIRVVYSLMNQNHDFKHIPKWDGSMLTNFMVANDSTVKISDDYIEMDGIFGKSMSTKSYPEQWNITGVIDYVGSIFRDDNFTAPFIITLNTTKLKEFDKTRIKGNAGIVMSQQMPYALFPRLKHKHQDLAYGMEKLEKGEDLYYASFGIFIFGSTVERLREASGQIETYFRGIGFKMEEDKYVNFPAFLTHLPLGYDMEIQDFLGKERGRAIFGENVADLAPISSDWKGNGSQIPLISPRGQLMGLDLFANETGGYNSFIVGMTGSGKSVFLQWLLEQYYLSNNQIWIIDIGRSYEKFTFVFGGQFIELKRDEPLCLNPFSSINDAEDLKEYLDFLIDFFLLIGLPREKTLSEQLEKLIKSHLEEAIKDSYEIYGKESCIDTVMKALGDGNEVGDPRIIDFIQTSKPYCSEGQYGAFFNGQSNVNFSSSIVCMENDTLENVPDLRDPTLMLLTFHISKQIYMSEKTHPGQRHVVVIDEAHKFLGQSAHIDLFIEQAYRRFRKHGAAMILGSQGFEDFYGGETASKAGRVIVQNSFYKFLMMQTATSRQALKNSKVFEMSPYEEAMMDSVAPVKGQYGETMLIAEGVMAKARILLDPFQQVLLFTDSELRDEIDKLVKTEGKTYLEAVEIIKKQKAA